MLRLTSNTPVPDRPIETICASWHLRESMCVWARTCGDVILCPDPRVTFCSVRLISPLAAFCLSHPPRMFVCVWRERERKGASFLLPIIYIRSTPTSFYHRVKSSVPRTNLSFLFSLYVLCFNHLLQRGWLHNWDGPVPLKYETWFLKSFLIVNLREHEFNGLGQETKSQVSLLAVA